MRQARTIWRRAGLPVRLEALIGLSLRRAEKMLRKRKEHRWPKHEQTTLNVPPSKARVQTIGAGERRGVSLHAPPRRGRGVAKFAPKTRRGGGQAAIAAVGRERVIGEAADVLYHLLVVLHAAASACGSEARLSARTQQSGLDEN